MTFLSWSKYMKMTIYNCQILLNNGEKVKKCWILLKNKMSKYWILLKNNIFCWIIGPNTGECPIQSSNKIWRYTAKYEDMRGYSTILDVSLCWGGGGSKYFKLVWYFLRRRFFDRLTEVYILCFLSDHDNQRLIIIPKAKD